MLEKMLAFKTTGKGYVDPNAKKETEDKNTDASSSTGTIGLNSDMIQDKMYDAFAKNVNNILDTQMSYFMGIQDRPLIENVMKTGLHSVNSGISDMMVGVYEMAKGNQFGGQLFAMGSEAAGKSLSTFGATARDAYVVFSPGFSEGQKKVAAQRFSMATHHPGVMQNAGLAGQNMANMGNSLAVLKESMLSMFGTLAAMGGGTTMQDLRSGFLETATGIKNLSESIERLDKQNMFDTPEGETLLQTLTKGLKTGSTYL